MALLDKGGVEDVEKERSERDELKNTLGRI